MSLINRAISSLFNGASQQPPALRAASQSEAVENGLATVAEGVRKRPPTQHIARLTSSTPSDAFVHQVFRNDSERYTVLVSSGSLRVFDAVTGVEAAVDTTTFAGVAGYLTCTSPLSEIGATTVADTTFIWNKTRTVGTNASALSSPIPTLYIYVKEARQDATYYVTISGIGTASYTPPSAVTSSTVNIATQLVSSIAALGGGSVLTASVAANVITVRRVDLATFGFSVYDSQGSNMMVGMFNRVERYSDLPRTFTDGSIVEVRGSAEKNATAFWVKFRADVANSTGGYWEETTAPVAGEVTDFNHETLPVALVRLTATTFRLERPTWAPRRVGSVATTCPLPSFVGDKVNCVFFWRGRLGFLSGENVILSRTNDLYNFWPKSSTQVNDDDPIDATVNSPKVAVLRHAVPFQRNLTLFSESAQATATAEGALTPRTFRVDVTTEYDCNPVARPVSSGRDIFFAFKRSTVNAGAFAGVREYFVEANSITSAANDITAHVPQYIPSEVFRLSVSSTEDLLIALAPTKTGQYHEVSVYKYLWNGEDRVQSAWMKWSFLPSDKVLSAEIYGSSIYFVIQRVAGIFLERMDLPYSVVDVGIGGTRDFFIHLDRRVSITGTYNSASNETTWILPYETPEGTVEGVAGPLWGTKKAVRLNVRKLSLTEFAVAGNWSTYPCIFGVPYEFRLRVSRQYMRDRQNNAIEVGRLQMRQFGVVFRDTGALSARVTLPGRDVATYKWSPHQASGLATAIGTPVLRTGRWAFPVASNAANAVIDIVNDTPFPSCVYAADWSGVFTSNATRV